RSMTCATLRRTSKHLCHASVRSRLPTTSTPSPPSRRSKVSSSGEWSRLASTTTSDAGSLSPACGRYTVATTLRLSDMRFGVVRAEAFGGLSQQELRLTPGMTIVCGPNEAAKSTWHAALYAALCGMRRGRGQPRRADRAFEDRHRPWDNSSEWAVSAVVELDD